MTLAGVDVSKRVSMEDVTPDEMSDIMRPTMGTKVWLAESVRTLAGEFFGLDDDGTAALLNPLWKP